MNIRRWFKLYNEEDVKRIVTKMLMITYDKSAVHEALTKYTDGFARESALAAVRDLDRTRDHEDIARIEELIKFLVKEEP